ATDRYRVHQLHTQIEDTATSGSFLMDTRIAKRLVTSWHTPRSAYRDQLVTIRWTDAVPLPKGHVGRIPRQYTGPLSSALRAAAQYPEPDRLSLASTQVRGNCPPVTGLFDEPAEDAGAEVLRDIALNTHFVDAT